MRALLVGATGLVGSACLDLLLHESAYTSVTALVRRPIPGHDTTPRLHTAVVDFERLDAHTALFSVDQIFCALGTTIRKAGTRAAFRRVDVEYPLAVAAMGLRAGAHHLLLVSSAGARSRSRIFYTRTKGELEDAVLRLGYRSVTILRPSILLGERNESRPGEALAKRFGFLLPRRYRPVEARTVAAALVTAGRADRPGVRIVENDRIPVLAGGTG